MEPNTVVDVTAQAAAVAAFAKVLVDITKAVIGGSGKLLPILALVYSEVMAFLLFATGTAAFTRQSIALTVIVGIAAAGGAVAITEISRKSEDMRDGNQT